MAEEQKPQRPKHELAILEAKQGFMSIVKDPEVWIREAAFALQAMAESRFLQLCTPESIRKAVSGVALTGTTLNPNIKLAYLVPRQDHGVWKACLQFSYRGGIKTVVDGGSIRGVRAVVVYDFDHFDYNMGTPPFVKHKHGEPPGDDFEDKPELILKHFTHCFSVATFVDGTEEILVLPRWKILKNMKTSAQYRAAAEKMAKGEKGKGIHDNWMEEMLRKTQFVYHCKSLPISDKAREMLAFAHEADRVIDPPEDRGSTAKDLMGRFGFNAENGAGEGGAGSGETTPAIDLQLIYRMLADVAKASGESPDDLLNRLTDGSIAMQQDLEDASIETLSKLRTALDAELAKTN